MREIEVTVSIGLVGCKRTFKIKVDDEASDGDIDADVEEYARERVIEIGWKEVAR